MEKVAVRLVINGEVCDVLVEPRRTLLDAIREDCGLTGTHVGCEHGVCGACTVLLDGEAVRACLMFAVQAEGCAIRTVEGLAVGGVLHPLQQAFIDHHGLQCGFCTAGFLMLAVGALERQPVMSEAEVVDLVSANLCRCTGYAGIVDAIRAVSGGYPHPGPLPPAGEGAVKGRGV